MSIWLAALSLFLGMASFAGAATPASQTPAQSASAPSYAALADLLSDRQSREALIARLRTLAARHPSSADAAATYAASQVGAGGGTGERAAMSGGGLVSAAQRFVVSLGRNIETLIGMLHGRAWIADAYAEGRNIFPPLAAAIVAVVVAFLALRAAAIHAFRKLDGWGAHSAPPDPATGRARPLRELCRGVRILASGFFIDLAVVLLAGAIGYGVSLFAAMHWGARSGPGSAFIGTFLAVEIACLLTRAVFASGYSNLRLIRMPDDVAAFWSAWFARLIRITGYGLLVAVPVARRLLLPAAGGVLSLLIVSAVYVYAVRVILIHRVGLRERMLARAATVPAPLTGTLLRVLARVWHLLGIAYFTVLLVSSQIDPDDALSFLARATLQTLLAVGIGWLCAAMLASVFPGRVQLSKTVRARLPMLETRINAYVPAALGAVRLFIAFGVVLAVLDAWHAFNLPAWAASASGQAVLAAAVRVFFVILAAVFVWAIVASVIESRLSGAPGRQTPSNREATLLALFRNAALVVISTLAVLVVLSQVGVAVGPLVAGAGVVGLALGFGAQKLVQDVITGVFIQLENGMNQNDVVELCGLFGTVEKITIRSVVVRTLDGGYHLIPFSTVDKLTNHTRDFGYHYGEYSVGHRENTDDVIARLEEAFDELMRDTELAPYVMERISIPGVTSLTERGFTVRVLIKTAPGAQWMIQRGFNRLVKKHFDAAGIEIPYPHSVVQFEGGRDGEMMPLSVRMEAAAHPQG
ncbi:MAG: mechanosensitive ion channel [Candidimonas sp.]|nr:MAG: mechanosensitive ion channel [Candidimonas sp.]